MQDIRKSKTKSKIGKIRANKKARTNKKVRKTKTIRKSKTKTKIAKIRANKKARPNKKVWVITCSLSVQSVECLSPM